VSDLIEGVIHGKTIELSADPGLVDGQRVVVRVVAFPAGDVRIEAIQRSADCLSGMPSEAWDDLEEIVRQRQGAGNRREVPE
jgi:hypothetical protein